MWQIATDVACLSVCVSVGPKREPTTRLNRLRCRLGYPWTRLGNNEPNIRWGSGSPQGKGQFRGDIFRRIEYPAGAKLIRQVTAAMRPLAASTAATCYQRSLSRRVLLTGRWNIVNRCNFTIVKWRRDGTAITHYSRQHFDGL